MKKRITLEKKAERGGIKMHLIEIRRPLETDRKELQHFFDIMLKSTFDKNGIANLVEDRQTELQEKQDQLNEDFASGGKKRYFLLATDKATGDLLGCIAYGPVSALIVRETKGEFTICWRWAQRLFIQTIRTKELAHCFCRPSSKS